MDAREALAVVAAGKTLTRADAEATMGSVMAGEATPSQLGALLAALHMRGETPDEIAGFASVLRANALRVVVDDDAIDVVTGLMCDIAGSIKSEQRQEWRARVG